MTIRLIGEEMKKIPSSFKKFVTNKPSLSSTTSIMDRQLLRQKFVK